MRVQIAVKARQMQSATKGRKAETIRTPNGFQTKTFKGHRAVCFVSCYGGKVQYEYTYPTLDEASEAARNFCKQPDTVAYAQPASLVQ